MAKKNGRRYTDQEGAAILTEMKRNRLTQVATAKKHGVSAMTIWTWNRAAKRGRSTRHTRARRAAKTRFGTEPTMRIVRGRLRTGIMTRLPRPALNQFAPP